MKLYKVIRLRLPRSVNLRNLKVWRIQKKSQSSSRIRPPKNIGKFLCIIGILILLLFLFLKVKNAIFGKGHLISYLTAAEEAAPEEPKKDNIWKHLLFLQETLPFFSPAGPSSFLDNQTDPSSSASAAFLEKYFAFDPKAALPEGILTESALLSVNTTVDLSAKEPKILIFHTHSQEEFLDSRAGVAEDTIVGIGNLLSDILATKYGFSVVHDVGVYDISSDGKLDRSHSYETMEASITKLLEKYPTIEVLLDLHRDGVEDTTHLVGSADGKQTAKLMFVNGVCYENENGLPVPTDGLENPYVQENLGFSYQMQLRLLKEYPSLVRRIYIKPYRYSLNMKPLSLLVEVGANTNTKQEAKNAMEPFAKVLVDVLTASKS